MFRIATDVVQIYRTFCTVHDMKTYLMLNIDRHMKLIMTRFRLGRSGVAVHQFRYKRHIDNEPICPLCREVQEDELQFHLCCPMRSDLRSQFIALKFYRFPILFRLGSHLASTNQNIVRLFSMCLYKEFQLRNAVRCNLLTRMHLLVCLFLSCTFLLFNEM